MSNKNRPRLSLKGDPNALITEPTQQAQVEISAPTQEKPMEAVQEKTPEASAEVNGLTAKQIAAAEEANGLRARQIIEAQQQDPIPSTVPIADVASRGFAALHEARRKHLEAQQNKPVYVPPPRTANQMSRLQEELEAGAKRVAVAAQQKAASQPVKPDGNKEGFTTPVYRPNDVVPDPTMKGVVKGYSPDV